MWGPAVPSSLILTTIESQLCLFGTMDLQDGSITQKERASPGTETAQLQDLLQCVIESAGMLRSGRAGSLPRNPVQEQRREQWKEVPEA